MIIHLLLAAGGAAYISWLDYQFFVRPQNRHIIWPRWIMVTLGLVAAYFFIYSTSWWSLLLIPWVQIGSIPAYRWASESDDDHRRRKARQAEKRSRPQPANLVANLVPGG